MKKLGVIIAVLLVAAPLYAETLTRPLTTAIANALYVNVSGDTMTGNFAPRTLAFASLGTPSNGTITYCSDCTTATPCAGAGTGALAVRANSAWSCGSSGASAPFSDATALVKNAGDATKTLTISLAGVTTGNDVALAGGGTGSFGVSEAVVANSPTVFFLGPLTTSGIGMRVAGTYGGVLSMDVLRADAGAYAVVNAHSYHFSTGLGLTDFGTSTVVAACNTAEDHTVPFLASVFRPFDLGEAQDLGLSKAAPGSAGLLAVGNGAALDTSGWTIDTTHKRLSADVTNATATFGNLSDLTQTVVAGRKYTGRLTIKCNDSVAAEGIKFDFNGGSATATAFWAAASESVGGTTVLGTVISTSLAGVINYTTITGETIIEIPFALTVNAGGTFIPRVAQNSHTAGTVTAELGSFGWTYDTP